MPNKRTPDIDDELEPEAAKFLQDFRVFLSGYWGDRCLDRQPGCKTCQMWALYDVVELSFDPR